VEKFNVFPSDFMYFPKSPYWWMAMGYYVAQTLTMVFEMYCLMTATLISVLGPTLALNGPRGSMQDSVAAMKEERLIILHSFWMGAVSFFFMQCFAVLSNAPTSAACVCVVVLLVGMWTMVRAMGRIKQKFRYSDIYAGEDDGKGNLLRRNNFSIFVILKQMFEGETNGEPTSFERARDLDRKNNKAGWKNDKDDVKTQQKRRASSVKMPGHYKASYIISELEANDNNTNYLESGGRDSPASSPRNGRSNSIGSTLSEKLDPMNINQY
jgi:hypothetical protein